MDLQLPAELVAIYIALREAGPHVIKWAPKIRDAITGQRTASAAAAVSDAQAQQIRAQADATVSAAWATLAATQSADYERRLQVVERAEAECRERADKLEKQAQAIEKRLREEFQAELRVALHTRARRAYPTPSSGHSTVTAPIDPLETPPDGHRLSAPNLPALPAREDTDPTPDLHASVTPR